MNYLPFTIFLTLVVIQDSSAQGSSSLEDEWYTIKGKVTSPEKKPSSDWYTATEVIVNGGEHITSLREDGTFVLTGIPSGSFVVEVVHPNYQFDSARIDITSKGKIRARRVNYIQPSQVTHVTYPLRLAPIGPYRYFQAREQWRITDVLFSPMVLMMILPLVLIVILPKMMSDPETRREMESVTMPKYEMPEMSEMLTSFFGGAKKDDGERKKAIRAKKNS